MIYSFSSDIIVTDSTQEQSSNILLLKTGLNTRYTNKEQSFITPLDMWEKISLGNAIKIIDHKLTNIFGSSCHQIVAKIYKVNNFNSTAKPEEIDS